MTRKIKNPFPYFGGKSRVAGEVWRRFGDVRNYVEPFCGGCGVLLNRPDDHTGHVETINDKWGFIPNFFRAVKAAPEAVARYCDWPVTDCDLQPRHRWLLDRAEQLEERLRSDPDFFDAKAAGWWCWGQCAWIGWDWCVAPKGDAAVHRRRPCLEQRGVHRPAVHKTARATTEELLAYFDCLADRLRLVRILCGDWGRALTVPVTTRFGVTGVFLDPPYTDRAGRRKNLYARDSGSVGDDVFRWAAENGDNPKLRIAVCGYAGEYAWPKGWGEYAWASTGGTKGNRKRERIWFSPHCLT